MRMLPPLMPFALLLPLFALLLVLVVVGIFACAVNGETFESEGLPIVKSELQFDNPESFVTVSKNSHVIIYRNHSYSEGGATGYFQLVTAIGDVNCTDFRSQISVNVSTPSCQNDGIAFYNLENVVDPVTLAGKFKYHFIVSPHANVSYITWQSFPPWRSPMGPMSFLKFIVIDKPIGEF